MTKLTFWVYQRNDFNKGVNSKQMTSMNSSCCVTCHVKHLLVFIFEQGVLSKSLLHLGASFKTVTSILCFHRNH